ncbi:MAG: bifunctional 3,4-dihydroxy-2-butanone-4-phosphate synthase/GTP cyclohydrolase II [Bacteroidales bacterium]|jgi:3,4-dihydroxy 2-butanone 4-phosphate synthase/GTP cyclohydrolase II|nr:bifunctional 3,4-dihydroxy-2-butanone-4-phosphate synthase/GTP cyclohydrolase II [Bacteroidales bacterium]
MTKYELNTIEEAIEDIRDGKLLIVVDDEDRENEGDFICAAEKITPEIINFMAKHGRGLICAALPEDRCDELELDLMVPVNTSIHETQFTVTVDLVSEETTTGVSAKDRALTIRALVDPATKPSDLGRPGHILPLRAKEKGVLRRAGHTEAVVDLTRFAGLTPGGVLVEIMKDDGSMARLADLVKLRKKFGIKIISIRDLIKYKLSRDTIIEKGETVKLPTDRGEFEFIPFRQLSNGLEHAALVKGKWTRDEPVLVRVHSSCFTGDIFGSLRCDCGAQLHSAMEMVEKEGKGVVIYLSQEGRGIGLFNKIKAYRLQDEGMDTVQANLKLGFSEDERDYGVGASIMRELGLGKVRLISNNPVKRAGLEGYGIQIVETLPLIIESNPFNQFYLETKANKMGHNLTCYKHVVKDQ